MNLLTADHRLMFEEPDRIINGLKLIMKVLNSEKGIVGIEMNKPDAIALFTEKSKMKTFVQPLEVKYPQGGENS